MFGKKTLIWQISLLVTCALVMGLWAVRFPYPSPVIFNLLSPHKRWPSDQVEDWVISGHIDDGFMSFFYRDPDRDVPNGANMVAPADGTVRFIDERNGVKYLVIALTFWDVHVQRSPVAGKIIKIEDRGEKLMDGEGIDLAYLEGKVGPVQKVVHIDTEWGIFKVRLLTSLLARRLEVWPEVGDVIGKGERLGRIHLGSTVVVDFPSELDPAVEIGDEVVAGETILFTNRELSKIREEGI